MIGAIAFSNWGLLHLSPKCGGRLMHRTKLEGKEAFA